MEPVAEMEPGTLPEMEPVTLSIKLAVLRHPGITEKRLQKMCQLKQIRGQKVGKYYHIPVAELDRVFLGRGGNQ